MTYQPTANASTWRSKNALQKEPESQKSNYVIMSISHLVIE
jgi:hypothetical protein